MSSEKERFFISVKSWFLSQKELAEIEWNEVITNYGNEPYFGRILRNAGHKSSINFGEIHDLINFPVSWNYEVSGGFFFNAFSGDLERGQFEELKLKLSNVLGKPDEIFSFYGLNEPTWKSGDMSFGIEHIDTHGGGYERVFMQIPVSHVKNGT